MTGKILRLYPLPAQETSAIYEDLELPPPERRDASRAYVIINMVSSLDGKSAIEGKASRIGSRTDRQTMRTLRSKADAVMIGANTLRAEKLSLGVDDPSEPQPLAVIVTRTGNVPLESNLIKPERQEVMVLTTEDAHLGERAGLLRVPAIPSGDVDLREALNILKADHGVNLLLVEGGTSLNYALISQRLADELFLTLAPKLLGGSSSDIHTILDGAPLPLKTLAPKLVSVHLAGDEIFLRYALL